MEVFHYILFLIYFLNYFNLFSSILLNLSSHLQALQKICLADDIRQMPDLLHADAIQQLEVALFGFPALEVIDLFSGRLVQAKLVTVTTSPQPHPCTYTSTPPAPPPASVTVVGVSEVEVSESSHIPAVLTMELKSDEKTTLPKPRLQMNLCQFQSVIMLPLL